MKDCIEIIGANENNLKNVNVTIPRNKLVLFTGLSGSGKSSLAFDTIFAEGQRRYMESLSSYARQFLGQMQKPSLSASKIATNLTSGRSSPSLKRLIPTMTSISPARRLLIISIRSIVLISL